MIRQVSGKYSETQVRCWCLKAKVADIPTNRHPGMLLAGVQGACQDWIPAQKPCRNDQRGKVDNIQMINAIRH